MTEKAAGTRFSVRFIEVSDLSRCPSWEVGRRTLGVYFPTYHYLNSLSALCSQASFKIHLLKVPALSFPIFRYPILGSAVRFLTLSHFLPALSIPLPVSSCVFFFLPLLFHNLTDPAFPTPPKNCFCHTSHPPLLSVASPRKDLFCP